MKKSLPKQKKTRRPLVILPLSYGRTVFIFFLISLSIMVKAQNSSDVQMDEDPDHLGVPVYVGKVEPLVFPTDKISNRKLKTAFLKSAKMITKSATVSDLEWPAEGAVHIEKTAEATSTFGRWKINLKVEGKNIQTTTDVVLVIDDSGSMKDDDKMDNAKAAANKFVNNLLGTGNSNIRIAIVTINSGYFGSGQPQIDKGFTSNAQELHTTINNISANGGTNLQGGFYAARGLLDDSDASNKTVVLLSDGNPTYSYKSATTTNFALECGNIDHFNISRNDFEANYLTIAGSDYEEVDGNGKSFDITLYRKTIHCGEKYREFKAGNHGIPTKYEAGLMINEGYNVYTIGFEVPKNGDAEDVLEGSQNRGYYPANNSNINQVYSEIASNIAYAATNAVLTDPMSTYIELEAGTTPSFSVLPNTSGDIVVSKGTVSITPNGKILNDPDEPTSGDSEKTKWKITWNIGTVSESGDEMYYFVTMADNTTPTTLYPANETTYMKYTDVNDNPNAIQSTANYDFTIPLVSGGKGSIEIIYYRVNQNGEPVNSNGVVVPLANAQKILPESSIYFQYNGSTALEVNNTYLISPEKTYSVNNHLYELYCSFSDENITPTPSAPNKTIWFGYTLNTPPITKNKEYCLGDVAEPLTATLAPGYSSYSLYYYTTETGGTPQTSITPSTNNIGTTDYWVAQGMSDQCISINRKKITVTVNPLPEPSITGNTIVCNTGSEHYSTNLSGANTYKWKVTGGTITSASTANSIDVSWNTTGTGKVYVTETNPNTECYNTDSLEVNISSSSYGTDTQTACDSYTWIDGNTYTESNNSATYTLTNAAGCDSIVTLDLTINKKTYGTDTQTACDSYTWIDGNTYTESNNSATYTLTNAAGCDSIVTLDLTINKTSYGTDTQTACDSYTWIDGNTYTESNNSATYTLSNAAGCDSIVTLDLTINKTSYGTDTQTACDSYTWIDGNTYTESNNSATYSLTNAAGCDSIVTLNLTINKTSYGTDTQTACDSYTWIDGNTYTESNNAATYTLTNAAGCDSIVTLDLTINKKTYGTDTQTACDSYTWIDGNTYTESNNAATYTLTNAAGCDSIVTLDLTINKTTYGTDIQTACDSYTWIDGNTYTESNNSATYTLTNAAGCDSIVTLDLTINKTTYGTDTQTACDSYTWIDGNTYTESNNAATYTLTNAAGCDSIVTMDLTINKKTYGTDTQTACDSYTWIDGNTYTESNNSATYSLTNAAGCDSIVTLDLTINKKTYGTDTQTACDSYTWIDGNTYTESNNSATYTLSNAAGCDSIVTLDLTINKKTYGTDTQTACDSYTWIDGNTYTESNNSATYTLTNAAGCDSIVTLDLTINKTSYGTDTQTACDSYTWIDGNTYTESNNSATYTLTNAAGCDSIVTLDLTINKKTYGTDTQTACDSYTWIDGNTYTESNNAATYTLTNAAGCDSIVTLDLTINKTTYGTDIQTACDSYTWIDGNTYTESNNSATYTLSNAAGCDSIVTLDLTINKTTYGTDTQTACDSYTWIDGNTYTESNNSATYTLTNAAGCDSIVTLDLTINKKTYGTDTQTACDSYTWIDGNTYTESNNAATYTLTNAAGCDSIVTLDLTINKTTYGTDIQTACDSYTWIDGNTYTESNNSATYTLTNAAGCDSIVTLDLTINKTTYGTDTQTACDSYTWIDGNTYTESNNAATYTLTNAAGCDSIVTMDLTINKKTYGTDTQTACDSYTWIDGNTYTESNNSATYSLTNAAGCDSIVTLDLTINKKTYGTDTQTACDSYTWIDGNTYTESNNSATYTLSNAAGCDSIVTLDLTINKKTYGTDTQTACDSYTWIDGNTYTESNNSATYTLTNAAGCDSIVTLDLTINKTSYGTDTQTACDSYTWIDGNTYTESNNSATYTLSNAAGCDSIVTLDLTINKTSYGTDTQTACDSYTWIDGNTYTESNNSATYSLTNAAGCDSIVTLDLTIIPFPDAPVSSGDITACEESTIQTLDANNALASTSGITWYDAATDGNTVANPIIDAVGTITYYAESSNGNCTSLTRTPVTLTINEAPDAPFSSGDITVCEESTIQTLDANNTLASTTGITWYDAATNGNMVTNPILEAVGTITYYAEYSNGNCSSLTRTPVTLTINGLPEATVSQMMTAECGAKDGVATVSVSEPDNNFSFLWDNGNTNKTATDLLAGMHSVEVTNQTTGCSTSLSLMITETDTKAPVIICPADIDTTIENEKCQIALTIPTPEVNDNCSANLAISNNFNNTADASGLYNAGTTTIVWTVTDNAGNSNTCEQHVTVKSHPVAVNDILVLQDFTPIPVAPLTNDTDCDNNLDPTSFEITIPGKGSISDVNTSNGTFTYTPTSGFSGKDSIQYKICDEDGLCDEAWIIIQINQSNNPPVAENDTIVAGDCRPTTINVLLNDYDPDGDELTSPIIISDVNVGVLSSNTDGSFEYTPESGFVGNVTFIYEICDVQSSENQLCAQATVVIKVSKDTDCDNVPDNIDIDADNDGILNTDDGITADNDGDGIPNYLDIDSDNDGILDNIEGQPENNYRVPQWVDTDGDGWDDEYDPDNGGTYFSLTDTDEDGTPDFIDTNTDDDSLNDLNEGWDANFDTTPDVEPLGTDSDGDGLDDAFDSIDGWNNITNPIGSSAPLPDYNNDGVRDWRDRENNKPIPGDGDNAAVGCEISIPNGFSPNGDNINDYFEIRMDCDEGESTFAEAYPNAKMYIYNRWGNLLYEKERYGEDNSPDSWWDGKSQNDWTIGGNKVPSATYVYILILEDGTVYKGTVYVNY